MSQNPLSALKIDYWYKLLPIIGTVILILGLTVDMKSVSNTLVQLVSIGVIFVGIGEWINHPLQEEVGLGFKLTGYNRINTITGNLWDLLGISLVIFAFMSYR